MSSVILHLNHHQPDYQRTRPWTLLHLIGGYTDQVVFLRSRRMYGPRVSINITGSLLKQVMDYENLDKEELYEIATLEDQDPKEWLGYFYSEWDAKDALYDAVQKFRPRYAGLVESGLVELMGSPYSHPLLPLLPENHAKAQIQKGQELFKKAFGFKPESMWSPECAVSGESVKWLGEKGIRSTFTGGSVTGGQGVWRVNGVNLYARDDGISDAIGFDYQHWDGVDAARDIKRRVLENPGLTIIALDGENYLPTYKNRGADFMLELYTELEGLMVTPNQLPDAEHEYRNLQTGSWVWGSLYHWMDTPYKRYVQRVKAYATDDFDKAVCSRSSDAVEAIFNVQSSDWAWFSDGPLASVFEAHVDKMYDLIGVEREKMDIPGFSGGSEGSMMRSECEY